MTKSVFTNDYNKFRRLLIEFRKRNGLTQEKVADKLKRPQSFVSKYENGERRLDFVEFIEISRVLGIDIMDFIRNFKGGKSKGGENKQSVLDLWRISPNELTILVDQNPSLRGILLGYVAEMKFQEIWLNHKDIKFIIKHDDHAREKKGDRVVNYRGQDIIIEVKSLQTNSIKREGEFWRGKTQVDASDRRKVTLNDGSNIETTCLRVGEFDLLAVNLFAFENEWRFVFAKNKDLPRSTYRKYTEFQRKSLLATLINVSWPPEPPFYEAPFTLLDELVRDEAGRRSLTPGVFTKTRK